MGSKKQSPDSLGRTDLHYAVFDGNLSLAKSLLLAGADPCAVDRNGWTPLHAAVQSHVPELITLLLMHGAPVDAQDSQGNTALFRAVFESRGRADVIRLLRSAGADPNRQNLHGVSPVALARTIANYDVAKFFSDVPLQPVA